MGRSIDLVRHGPGNHPAAPRAAHVDHRSVLIPTDGLPMNPLDGQHHDLTGYKLWAERGLAVPKMNGWTPWARP